MITMNSFYAFSSVNTAATPGVASAVDAFSRGVVCALAVLHAFDGALADMASRRLLFCGVGRLS